MDFNQTIQSIEEIDLLAQKLCKERWDRIAKPLSSLGKLEDGIIQIAGIMGTSNVKLDKKALVIMCGDNGVVEEGVTQSGQEITALVAENFLTMNSCVCIMAQQIGVQVFPIDIGIARDTKLIQKKIAYGTQNMRKGPAMSREQAMEAVEVGIHTVEELKQDGFQIIATGEMGIGNTTTSSAIASVLLDIPVEEVTGPGAGLSKEGVLHKIKVIQDSILRNQPDKKDPIDVLAKVGGFDIAGLVGIYLGGAALKIPIVMDGFISSVAALLAIKIEPKVKQYIICSHVSKETAGQLMLDAIGVTPYLTCNMCLGEGTGAVGVFPILEMGLAVYTKMSTFEENEMEAYQPL